MLLLAPRCLPSSRLPLSSTRLSGLLSSSPSHALADDPSLFPVPDIFHSSTTRADSLGHHHSRSTLNGDGSGAF